MHSLCGLQVFFCCLCCSLGLGVARRFLTLLSYTRGKVSGCSPRAPWWWCCSCCCPCRCSKSCDIAEGTVAALLPVMELLLPLLLLNC